MVKAKWRPNLDYLQVEMHLYGGLAFAYEAKPSDICNEWLPNQPVRQIIRQVSSTFWLYREILPYGADCVIVSPSEMRHQFRQQILRLCDRYPETP